MTKAIGSALYLNDVKKTIQTREGDLSETVAKELVGIDKKLGRSDVELFELKRQLDFA